MLKVYFLEVLLYMILLRRIGHPIETWNCIAIYVFICMVINAIIGHHSIRPLISDILSGAVLWIIVIVCALLIAL